MIYEITTSEANKDIPSGVSRHDAKDVYLNIYDDFQSKLPDPDFYPSPERDDIFILDFAKGPCGLKAHGAEKYIAELQSDVVGYAAPRVGHAAEAIASLCETYGKRAVFFSPASKCVSKHQVVVLGYEGSELRFARIPAMPTLNSWIRGWANTFNAVALPFGLANCPEVTAGLVNMCDKHSFVYGEPPEFYCAVSTGTMIRALQIGWPDSQAFGVAVARNIKSGEKGDSHVESYHKKFYESADNPPKFNTTATYDAKAYDKFLKEASPGAVFINVGSDLQIEKRIETLDKNWSKINSAREWGDLTAFSKP